eukprot:g9603.t1
MLPGMMWKCLVCFVWSLVPSTAFQSKPRASSASIGSSRNERSHFLTAVKRKPNVLPDLSQSEFPPLPAEPYDLIVLGSGPGGEAAAVQAARLGASVAVIETKKSFGGPTGLTSKAVREAAKQINQAVTNVGGDRRRQTRRMWKLRFPALRAQAEVLQAAETRDRLSKNLIDLYIGRAEILPDSKRTKGEKGEVAVRVCRPTACIDIPAHHVCIATGSRPNRPPKLRSGSMLPFKKGVVVDATEMGTITELPDSCAIIGGGVIAVEYANVLAGLGVGVSLLCKDEEFMPFLSEELRVELRQRMIRDRVLFVTAPIKRIDIGATDDKIRVQLEQPPKNPPPNSKNASPAGEDGLAEGLRRLFQLPQKPDNKKAKTITGAPPTDLHSKAGATDADAAAPPKPKPKPKPEPAQPRRLRVDLVLYSGGRDANTETLGCADAGVDLARYGRIKVDGSFRTSNPRVYAVGDVTGPPGLASSAQMGGRAVASYLFKDKMQRLRQYMLETSTDLEDVVDDPFFAAEAESASGAQRTSEQLQLEAETAKLGSDDSLATEGDKAESLFEKVAGAPLTLWTIPEISSVGLTEEEAIDEGLRTASQGGSLVTGYAYFKDIARGRLSGGDAAGFLKLVSRADEPTRHVVIGVQIIGEGANELIQMGSILIQSKSTLEEVSNTPFAAVTLSALYQVAADDGLCNSPYNLQRHPMRDQAYQEK